MGLAFPVSAEVQFVFCALHVHRVPTVHELIAIFILLSLDHGNNRVLHSLLLFESFLEVELVQLNVAGL